MWVYIVPRCISEPPPGRQGLHEYVDIVIPTYCPRSESGRDGTQSQADRHGYELKTACARGM
jgi:hypothetical protein